MFDCIDKHTQGSGTISQLAPTSPVDQQGEHGSSVVTSTDRSSSSSAIYVVELASWSISNDFTNPLATSNGINNALQWAKTNGYVEVVLPKGNYLIEKITPIKPPSDIVFNLGGATLKIETNGLQKYVVILLDNNQKNVIVKNGKLVGDRYEHDYTTVSGTHEWGTGINLVGNCKYIHLQDLDISAFTGDGIAPEMDFGYVTNDYGITSEKVILGSITNTTGAFVTSTNSIRTITPLTLTYPLPQKLKYIGLYGTGYGNLPGITTKLYSAYFYKNDDTFVSCVEKLKFFEEAPIPDGAVKVHFVIYQNTIPADFYTAARCPEIPQYIYITNNNLHHCRRQGISVIGARHVYIRGNSIHDIQGTDPQGGIDVEDGYAINQHIYIQDNHFYNNVGYNIVLVAGRYFVITGNRLRGVTKYYGFATNKEAEQVLMSNNIIDRCSVALSGEVVFSDNWVYGSLVDVGSDLNVLIHGCMFHNVALRTGGTRAYSTKIDDCKFYNDADKKAALKDIGNTLYLTGIPLIMTNCVIEGNDINYCIAVEDTVKEGYIFENVVFVNTTGQPHRLPPGQFVNCKFMTNAQVGISSAGDFLFRGCYLKQNLTTGITIDGGCRNVKIYNCLFECEKLQYGNSAISVRNAGQVMLEGNTIVAPALTETNFNIIEAQATFVGSLLLINNNTIITNTACGGINTSAAKAPKPCIVKNNNLNGGCTLNVRAGDVNLRNDLN